MESLRNQLCVFASLRLISSPLNSQRTTDELFFIRFFLNSLLFLDLLKMKQKSLSVFLVITVLLVFCIFILEYCKPANQDKADALTSSGDATYVGDQSCQGCHSKEFDLWKQSDHFKAMEPANDSTVLGDFNNVSLTADGITSRFFRKEGKYFINTQGPDGIRPGF